MYKRNYLVNLFLLIFSFGMFISAGQLNAAEETKFEVKAVEKPIYFESVGVLVPETVITFSSKLMGTITSVTKREGVEVKTDEVLVTIDDTELNADLTGLDAALAELESNKIEVEKNLNLFNASKATAQAQYNLSATTYERFKNLYENNKSISRQELDKAEADFKAATSKLNEASAQIEVVNSKKAQIEAKRKQINANIEKIKTMKNYTKITSPISGRVTARQAETGMLATPGTPLITVEDYKNMQFKAIIPENIINNIKIGDSIKVIVDVINDQVFLGEVAEIIPTGDIMTHTFTVKISLAYDPRLKSGTYARGLFVKARSKTLMIPTDFIINRGQLYMVYTSENEFRFIRPGINEGYLTEILSGLNEGDIIYKK